jgi:hypothetical protein
VNQTPDLAYAERHKVRVPAELCYKNEVMPQEYRIPEISFERSLSDAFLK